eukprot:591116-Alexandrium_andersonii.AAC.1
MHTHAHLRTPTHTRAHPCTPVHAYAHPRVPTHPPHTHTHTSVAILAQAKMPEYLCPSRTRAELALVRAVPRAA